MITGRSFGYLLLPSFQCLKTRFYYINIHMCSLRRTYTVLYIYYYPPLLLSLLSLHISSGCSKPTLVLVQVKYHLLLTTDPTLVFRSLLINEINIAISISRLHISYSSPQSEGYKHIGNDKINLHPLFSSPHRQTLSSIHLLPHKDASLQTHLQSST